jgi:cysteine synthase
MSKERFEIVRRYGARLELTPGCESSVKEIYDKCHELAQDPDNVILNQFAEFGNHIAHYLATGAALERVFASMCEQEPGLRLRAFVSATGSAGTIGAGDYLKEHLGSLIVACEALECPTMLRNGFGEHNIQGIGDKHIPLIHNVMNTDVAVAVSDRATDRIGVLFNTPAGRRYLADRCGVSDEVLAELPSLGLSSICNLLGAIKTAKHYGMGPDDVIVTVATDGASLYASEHELAMTRYFPDGFDEVAAAGVFGEHLLGAATDNLLELGQIDRERIFNLGYYTWVEQQGVSLDDFQVRRSQSFWSGLHEFVRDWDSLIDEFNAQTGVLESL